MTKITINPAIDPAYYADLLKQKTRIQIPNFFADDVVDEMHQLLTGHDKWFLAYNHDDEYFESPADEFHAMPAPRKSQFVQRIYHGANKGFQYFFMQYYITQAIRLGEDEGHPLHQFHHFANGPEFLDFMKTLTGEVNCKESDTFASMYTPGHFLTKHDDIHKKHDRVVAFVISMTKDWQPDWGGQLVFYDDGGNISEGFIPSYNTLNVFTIPQSHAVQMVNPFAGARRTSFLGWVHR